MFEFNALTFSIIVFLSALIPGGIWGMLLFRNSKFSLIEKLLCSFFLGLFIVPTLLFIENMAGIGFSFNLVVIDLLVTIAAGISTWAYLAFKGKLNVNMPKLTYGDLLIPSLLIIALLLAFWIRIQPFSPIYSELDPYWYVYGTGQIIKSGFEPVSDDTAWYPEVDSFHRGVPLKKYLEAEWYTLYTNGSAYNNYLLFTTASWLPPISAAMLCFGAYLIVSSIYGRKYGVFVAFLLACLPVTIFKMSAGVNEASPISMGLLFFSLGCLAYSLAKKDRAVYILTAFAFFATVLSTTYANVLALPFIALLIGQSIDYFARGKPNIDFIEICGYAYVGLSLGSIISLFYYAQNIGSLLGGPFMMASAGYGFALLCYFVPLRFSMSDQKRLQVLAAVAVFSLAAFLFTPIGGMVKSEIKSYVGNVDFNTALEKTIAEQNVAGDSFEGDAGFLALVPSAHASEHTLQGLFYTSLGFVSTLFTAVGNLAFRALDVFFNLLVGQIQTTSSKQDSVLFIFLVIAIVGMINRHFSRKEDREIPSIMILILAVLLPVFYVGMNKLKFTVFAGVAIAIVAPIAVAECERFVMWLFRKKETTVEASQDNSYYTMKRHKKRHVDAPSKPPFDFGTYIAPVFVSLIFIIAFMEFAGPVPYGYVFLLKSFEPRYQDDPIANAPIALQLCSDLKSKGVPENQIQTLCDAGKSPETFANTTNGQFNGDVCWLSQMTVDELIPGNDTSAQQRASEAVTSARFRCNRIADYWISSMEWMKTNLNSSDRITSWWDYGHWTNYFADTNTVLRNEHASKGMIGRVAHDFLIGSTRDLIDSMNYFDSQYVLFDVEIIGSPTFGGKYGALNYLGCVHEGDTSLSENPGTSDCEFQHSPERIVVPTIQAGQCTISESQQLTGTPAYEMLKTGMSSTPAYCVGTTTIATGNKITATYYIDKKGADGNLVLNKGFVRQIQTAPDAVYYEMVYTNDGVWIQNNTLSSGMEDAKTEFYKSNLYKGFILKQLPGFDLVYDTNEIKIYKMQNFTGNKERYIDPVASKMKN